MKIYNATQQHMMGSDIRQVGNFVLLEN